MGCLAVKQGGARCDRAATASTRSLPGRIGHLSGVHPFGDERPRGAASPFHGRHGGRREGDGCSDREAQGQGVRAGLALGSDRRSDANIASFRGSEVDVTSERRGSSPNARPRRVRQPPPWPPSTSGDPGAVRASSVELSPRWWMLLLLSSSWGCGDLVQDRAGTRLEVGGRLGPTSDAVGRPRSDD